MASSDDAPAVCLDIASAPGVRVVLKLEGPLAASVAPRLFDSSTTALGSAHLSLALVDALSPAEPASARLPLRTLPFWLQCPVPLLTQQLEFRPSPLQRGSGFS